MGKAQHKLIGEAVERISSLLCQSQENNIKIQTEIETSLNWDSDPMLLLGFLEDEREETRKLLLDISSFLSKLPKSPERDRFMKIIEGSTINDE